ncbi:protein of unknown function DUF903 [Desulfarculus baarsii DSM 2075]|uniref:Lipoprotein YgdI/YgdR-like SH3-like domain-containing protein n=1 Tax=Desulfarculus baarsii (strain ATCC 33931 / DSM 2075 / LMG 7858 / VKM B-1802 / 2st14) TaxID=644282 RepID=E1QDR4_DESB2|nr:YgdI/YgdR family lipoprotein [Desulfarculus baarsii]ADK83700.1 protein of unknown function DUF903 [Desulfarculus baarsii DSM 2075]
MHSKLTIAAICLGLALLAGCATPMHTITTTSGKQYVAVGDLDFDDDTKTYTFTDPEGHTVILNRNVISEIRRKTD